MVSNLKKGLPLFGFEAYRLRTTEGSPFFMKIFGNNIKKRQVLKHVVLLTLIVLFLGLLSETFRAIRYRNNLIASNVEAVRDLLEEAEEEMIIYYEDIRVLNEVYNGNDTVLYTRFGGYYVERKLEIVQHLRKAVELTSIAEQIDQRFWPELSEYARNLWNERNFLLVTEENDIEISRKYEQSNLSYAETILVLDYLDTYDRQILEHRLLQDGTSRFKEYYKMGARVGVSLTGKIRVID